MAKFLSFLLLIGLSGACLGQTESATLSGRVTDPSGSAIVGAEVVLTNTETNVEMRTKTNGAGLYVLTGVHPGKYRVAAGATRFKVLIKEGLVLHVQDELAENFALTLGTVSETVTVTADATGVNTTDATVSTVVDRQFAENLPMNGRSFQTLIQLTPGVVLTASNGNETGQFSVNGQRASSNYWMVDGVSANIGMSTGNTSGNGLGGALGSTSVLGGTNSLVSVDAMQEFRIQTSTYAPEFGRTPGGQISIVTRSGTNQFHGTVFDYLRNDVFDASNWFNGYTNNPPLPKAKERQNDFGGTLGGPILKNKTFFFFSYEGLRLRLPQTALTLVPDTNPQDPFSRQFAQPALLPYLNAFPQPNGPEVLDPNGNHQGIAQFNASFSNPATLDAYSLRIDHKLSDKLNVFGRYDYSPSELTQRGTSVTLSNVAPFRITTQTGTVGVTWAISTLAANDFRFNYSNTDASSSSYLDNFGGAAPLGALPFPSPFTSQNGAFLFYVFSLGNYPDIFAGAGAHNRQRQLNFVDSVSLQRGPHSIKFGIDFRRLSPRLQPAAYNQSVFFADVPSAEMGSTNFFTVTSSLPATLLFRNLGVFAQDTWRVHPRLTLTYGLRWDTDFVPTSLGGPSFNAAVGFNLSNLANLALAPAGTPPYKTTYGNVAPRIGLAYQVSQNPQWQTVIRGGFGVFYDLATSEAGNIAQSAYYPFGSLKFDFSGASFPLTGDAPNPAPIAPPNGTNIFNNFNAFDPKLRLPYTLQWNVAIEQSLGKRQNLTASYVGSTGRRLLQSASVGPTPPTFSCYPNFCTATLVTNASTSDYDALQLQFQRQMSRGLQALASYTWSHSIDTASAGSIGNASNELSVLNSSINRGPSDFDVRHALSLGVTYELPAPTANPLANAVLRGWSVENVLQARSAPPVDVYYSGFTALSNGFGTKPRPNVVAGVPLYLYGPQYPGGKAFNNTLGAVVGGCPDGSQSIGPFCPPPVDPNTGLPTGQGNLPRNALRGFGAAQWDFAVHRDFPIRESVKLQFRAEMFNLLNHPNFGQPVGDLGSPGSPKSQFGLSSAMLGQSLAGGSLGSGAFDPLYQLGGPRSIQFALKLFF
jgi:Carboxypeptidase regulatory-like domain/TonB dependent receptor